MNSNKIFSFLCQFQVVLSKRQIAKKYLQGLFIFDLLASVPFIVGMIMGHPDKEFNQIKLLNFLRISRLATFIRYLQRFLLRFEIDDQYLGIFQLILLDYLHSLGSLPLRNPRCYSDRFSAWRHCRRMVWTASLSTTHSIRSVCDLFDQERQNIYGDWRT